MKRERNIPLENEAGWRSRKEQGGGETEGGRRGREDEEEGGGENTGEEGDPSEQPSSSALLFGILSEQLPPTEHAVLRPQQPAPCGPCFPARSLLMGP